MTRPAEPRISRSLNLQLKGDWGTANLHRVCGWLGQEVSARSGPYTRYAVWNGRGGADNVRAVARGEVDVALATPAAFATAALDGRGVFAGEPVGELRALGVVPQRDRLVVAVRQSLGITSFEQLRAGKPALRLATGVNDGENFVGLAAHELLTRSKVDIEGWGGQWLGDEWPHTTFAHVLAGRADAVAHEAIMLPHWQEFGGDMHFLEVESAVLRSLEADFGWPAARVDAGWFPDADAFDTLDFSDFIVLTREDLPEDVGYAIAWVLGETREILENQYRHLPSERSPVTYPLDPVAIGRTPVPLHPGAAR